MEALIASTTAAASPSAVGLKLMSDERLARWAAKGSQAAFAVIFERHHQALHRYCHSIVGNGHDAADALQNTMLKALRALPGETRTIALKPWLYRIAHNESISLLRTRRADSDLDAAEHVGDPGAECIAESRERLRDLTADLQELTEQQRGALLMRELADLEFADIAAALHVSATAAKQSVYEGRCALLALQEGRAMDCDVVRRTLSDGDRRTLRNLKLRAHLRACAGCRDFEVALRRRPAHLAALTPSLPLAAGAAMLQGVLGAGAGAGAGHGGVGLLAGMAVGAKASGAFSLGAAKVASVVVIAGSAAGGAIYVAPEGSAQLADGPAVTRQTAPAAARSVAPAAGRDRSADRPSRSVAAEPAGNSESSEQTAAAGDAPAATATQRRRDAAPSPVAAAGRRALPAAGAAPDRAGQAALVDTGDGTARRRTDSRVAPAAAAPASARPAADAAPDAEPATTPQAAGAATGGAPTAARDAQAADTVDAW